MILLEKWWMAVPEAEWGDVGNLKWIRNQDWGRERLGDAITINQSMSQVFRRGNFEVMSLLDMGL
jgi:hypothetical protein